MPQITDPLLIRARLETDRPWTAFALADLDPANAPFATWFGPANSHGTVVLVYRAFARPLVVFTGSPEEWDSALDDVEAALDPTPDAHVVVKPELLPLVGKRYAAYEARAMWRMLLDPQLYHAVAMAPTSAAAVRLGSADLEAVRTLYAEAPPEFFFPAQLEEGIYYGIREGEAIVSIAGTHVVSETSRVAAVGNVHTRSDRRGRGLATAVTSALTRQLLQAGATTIVLNVRDDNDAARRVYERLGYTQYGRYYEGVATRRLAR